MTSTERSSKTGKFIQALLKQSLQTPLRHGQRIQKQSLQSVRTILCAQELLSARRPLQFNLDFDLENETWASPIDSAVQQFLEKAWAGVRTDPTFQDKLSKYGTHPDCALQLTWAAQHRVCQTFLETAQTELAQSLQAGSLGSGDTKNEDSSQSTSLRFLGGIVSGISCFLALYAGQIESHSGSSGTGNFPCFCHHQTLRDHTRGELTSKFEASTAPKQNTQTSAADSSSFFKKLSKYTLNMLFRTTACIARLCGFMDSHFHISNEQDSKTKQIKPFIAHALDVLSWQVQPLSGCTPAAQRAAVPDPVATEVKFAQHQNAGALESGLEQSFLLYGALAVCARLPDYARTSANPFDAQEARFPVGLGKAIQSFIALTLSASTSASLGEQRWPSQTSTDHTPRQGNAPVRKLGRHLFPGSAVHEENVLRIWEAIGTTMDTAAIRLSGNEDRQYQYYAPFLQFVVQVVQVVHAATNLRTISTDVSALSADSEHVGSRDLEIHGHSWMHEGVNETNQNFALAVSSLELFDAIQSFKRSIQCLHSAAGQQHACRWNFTRLHCGAENNSLHDSYQDQFGTGTKTAPLTRAAAVTVKELILRSVLEADMYTIPTPTMECAPRPIALRPRFIEKDALRCLNCLTKNMGSARERGSLSSGSPNAGSIGELSVHFVLIHILLQTEVAALASESFVLACVSWVSALAQYCLAERTGQLRSTSGSCYQWLSAQLANALQLCKLQLSADTNQHSVQTLLTDALSMVTPACVQHGCHTVSSMNSLLPQDLQSTFFQYLSDPTLSNRLCAQEELVKHAFCTAKEKTTVEDHPILSGPSAAALQTCLFWLLQSGDAKEARHLCSLFKAKGIGLEALISALCDAEYHTDFTLLSVVPLLCASLPPSGPWKAVLPYFWSSLTLDSMLPVQQAMNARDQIDILLETRKVGVALSRVQCAFMLGVWRAALSKPAGDVAKAVRNSPQLTGSDLQKCVSAQATLGVTERSLQGTTIECRSSRSSQALQSLAAALMVLKPPQATRGKKYKQKAQYLTTADEQREWAAAFPAGSGLGLLECRLLLLVLASSKSKRPPLGFILDRIATVLLLLGSMQELHEVVQLAAACLAPTHHSKRSRSPSCSLDDSTAIKLAVLLGNIACFSRPVKCTCKVCHESMGFLQQTLIEYCYPRQ